MADNVSITSGTGVSIRADELGSGVQVQVVKIALGADGVEDNLVDAGQQLMAASVPVAIASDQSALGVTVAAGTSTIGAVYTAQDVKIGAKSLALTLSSGVGSVPIPDAATVVGAKPVSSTSIRVGLEAPEADGTATGNATAGDLKKGIPVDAAVWTWFSLGGTGTTRVLYVKGGASDVVEVAVM